MPERINIKMKITNKNRTLAIISDYPIEGYLAKGYDFIFAYYNPLRFFDTVHFFEPYFKRSPLIKLFLKKLIHKRVRAMGEPYSLCIHRTMDYKEARKIFIANRIDCIRVYGMSSFALAKRLAEEFTIPLIVSIH
jgi:hypothetical protein